MGIADFLLFGYLHFFVDQVEKISQASEFSYYNCNNTMHVPHQHYPQQNRTGGEKSFLLTHVLGFNAYETKIVTRQKHLVRTTELY